MSTKTKVFSILIFIFILLDLFFLLFCVYGLGQDINNVELNKIVLTMIKVNGIIPVAILKICFPLVLLTVVTFSKKESLLTEILVGGLLVLMIGLIVCWGIYFKFVL